MFLNPHPSSSPSALFSVVSSAVHSLETRRRSSVLVYAASTCSRGSCLACRRRQSTNPHQPGPTIAKDQLPYHASQWHRSQQQFGTGIRLVYSSSQQLQRQQPSIFGNSNLQQSQQTQPSIFGIQLTNSLQTQPTLPALNNTTTMATTTPT